MAIAKFVLGVTAGLGVFAGAAEASASEQVLRSCVTPLNRGQIRSYTLPAGSWGIFEAPVAAEISTATCNGYTWVYSDKINLNFSGFVGWAGPVAEYCPHSDIEYAVYYWSSGSGWKYAGGGLLWGKDNGSGACSYSVSNWPDISYGSDMTRVKVFPWGYYMVAVRSWSHNHTGNGCANPTDCVWPTKVGYTRF